jgi:hypothetical protein
VLRETCAAEQRFPLEAVMTDRELLELAAKAAGYESPADSMGTLFVIDGDLVDWNPIFYAGDALRLATKLRMTVRVEEYGAAARIEPNGAWHGCEAHLYGGIDAATRRAIVRAAAEIGRTSAWLRDQFEGKKP